MDNRSAAPDAIWPDQRLSQPVAFELDGLPGLVDEAAARRSRRLGWALALSLLVHIAVFSLKFAPTPGQGKEGGHHATGPIAMRLLKRKTPEPRPVRPTTPSKPTVKQTAAVPVHPRSTQTSPRVMTAPPSPVKTWSRAQSDEVDKFTNDLAREPKTAPPAQPSFSQQALAMAHGLGRAEEMASERDEDSQQQSEPNKVDRFSMEMYLDALYRKLNRSAEMVGPGKLEQGRNIAAVSVSLNPDGTLKHFRVLYAADQAATIAYIESVFKRAAPFSPFPPDISKGRDSLTMQICIIPNRLSEGGAMFSPMGKGKGCRG